jgi:hypothetical protein
MLNLLNILLYFIYIWSNYIYILLYYYTFLYDSQGFLSILRKGEIVPLAEIQKKDIYIQDVHIVQIGHTCPMFDYIRL